MSIGSLIHSYWAISVLGRNLINYPREVGTTTVDMLTSKLIFNSILSTPYTKFMGIYIKNFYLKTLMVQYECMRLPIEIIP